MTLIIGLSAAAWIFSNFLIHAYYTLRTGIYSPGVVTAGAIYVPVSLYIFSKSLVIWINKHFRRYTVLYNRFCNNVCSYDNTGEKEGKNIEKIY